MTHLTIPEDALEIIAELEAVVGELRDPASSVRIHSAFVLRDLLNLLPFKWCHEDPLERNGYMHPDTNVVTFVDKDAQERGINKTATAADLFRWEMDGISSSSSKSYVIPGDLAGLVQCWVDSDRPVKAESMILPTIDLFLGSLKRAVQASIRVQSFSDRGVDLLTGGDMSHSSRSASLGKELVEGTASENSTDQVGSNCWFSDDHRLVTIDGKEFVFTDVEAEIVQFIHEQHQVGNRYVSKDRIVSLRGKPCPKGARIRDLFAKKHRNQVMSVLIMKKSGSRDMYYLNGWPDFGKGLSEDSD